MISKLNKIIKKKGFKLSMIFTFCFYFVSSLVIGQENSKLEFGTFKIQDIERVKNGYVLQLSNEDDTKWYTVVSIRKKIENYTKIQKGKCYKMTLDPYFTEDIFPNHTIIHLIELEGKTIYAESQSWTSNVYTSLNLIGLKYIDIKNKNN